MNEARRGPNRSSVLRRNRSKLLGALLLLVVSLFALAMLGRFYLWLKQQVAPATNLAVKVHEWAVAELSSTKAGVELMFGEGKEAAKGAVEGMPGVVRRFRLWLSEQIQPPPPSPPSLETKIKSSPLSPEARNDAIEEIRAGMARLQEAYNELVAVNATRLS